MDFHHWSLEAQMMRQFQSGGLALPEEVVLVSVATEEAKRKVTCCVNPHVLLLRECEFLPVMGRY